MVRSPVITALCLLTLLCQLSYGQEVLSLRVREPQGPALSGVQCRTHQGMVSKTDTHGIIQLTDTHGNVQFTDAAYPLTLHFSHPGYRDTLLTFWQGGHYTVEMQRAALELEEVTVNVGVYQIPRERSTGSFTFIDKNLLEQSPSTDILERLEGVAEGVVFDRTMLSRENQAGLSPGIRLRGLSTIASDRSPLIIVDNFPYEGDLSTVNPEDVENITVLKDAAASSIWGARAGNGVIVITLKKGRYDRPVETGFTASLSLRDRPDLYYSPEYLDAATVMQIEEDLFARKHYTERPQTAIPLYTEWLIRQRDGLVTDAAFEQMKQVFAATDIREQSQRYLYRTGSTQSYHVSLRGGGARHAFRWSGSHDRTLSTTIGNSSTRYHLNGSNTLKIGRKLSFHNELWYSQRSAVNNGIGITDLVEGTATVSPYLRLVEEDGQPAAIPRNYRYAYQETAVDNGLLDWLYRPVEERELTDRQSQQKEIRVAAGLDYAPAAWLHTVLKYQYSDDAASGYQHYDKESFYVRNLVNRYTQADGTLVIPYGDILRYDSPGRTLSHAGRAQLWGHYTLTQRHRLDYLAGMDISSQQSRRSPFQIIFDYDPELLSGNTFFDYARSYSLRPNGSGRIPAQGQGHSRYLSRSLSYYANVNYGYGTGLRLSGSMRWDGANIYGVKTNQKGVPLWSVGMAFSPLPDSRLRDSPLELLKMRLTYGSSGNSNRSVSVYPIISYDRDALSSLQYATLRDVGNPSLRWEQVRTANVGLDFSLFHRRITGSLEYYRKTSVDLIGVDLMDPTTGIIDQVLPLVTSNINYASLRGRGWDANIKVSPLRGRLQWESTILLSYARNKVTHFYTNYPSSTSAFVSSGLAVAGRSLDAMYVFPWHGLDDTGKPMIYLDGARSDNYQEYLRSYPVDDLVIAGEKVPPFTASSVNSLQYGPLSLGVSLELKTGHVFRRTTMSNTGELSGYYHRDYHRRWKEAGDERLTGVLPGSDVRNADVDSQSALVSYSEYVVEPGDVLRLRNVQLSYRTSGPHRALPLLSCVKNLTVSVMASHIGILWRANKAGIDPDAPGSTYPIPMTTTCRLSFDF